MDSVPLSIYHHRTVAPCRDCSDRFIGCHSTCKKYADWSSGDKANSNDARRKHEAEMLKQIKSKNLHFAWDRYEEKEKILPKFQMFKEITGINFRKLTVYVLCNFDTTIEQDLERIYLLRDLGFTPYVMIYNKQNAPEKIRLLQRWCNNKIIFRSVSNFDDYDRRIRRKEGCMMETSWKSQQGKGEYALQFETDDEGKYKLVEKAAQMAMDGKTIDDLAEVTHSEWKLYADGSGKCKRCGKIQRDVWDIENVQNYCCHCGADMRGERRDI